MHLRPLSPILAITLATMLFSSLFASSHQTAYASSAGMQLTITGKTSNNPSSTVTVKVSGDYDSGVMKNVKGTVQIGDKTISLKNIKIRFTNGLSKIILQSSLVDTSGSVTSTVLFDDVLDSDITDEQIDASKATLGVKVGTMKYTIRKPTAFVIFTEPAQNDNKSTVRTIPSTNIHVDRLVVLGGQGQDQYQARFSLLDKNLSETREDGRASFAILDGSRILYQSEFDVKKSDFGRYSLVLTGQEFTAYAWTIPLSKVSKGTSTFGRAVLNFTTSDGQTSTGTYELVSIPKYVDKEITQMYEEKWQTSSKAVALTLSTGDLRIAINRVGYFTHLKYDTWGDEVTEYRVDISVANTGSGKVQFYPFDSYITSSNGKQAKYSHTTKFDGGDIYSGSTKEGYVTFEASTDFGDVSKVILYRDYVFDLKEKTTYTVSQMYEAQYQKTAKSVGQTQSQGNFKISLIKTGMYTYSSYGNTQKLFRADFEITNLDTKPQYIPSSFYLLDDKGKQYDYTYGGTLGFRELLNGVTVQGYKLFKDFDGNASSIKVVVKDSGYPDDYIYTFDVGLSN